jgi:hypothetical protein
MSKENIKLKQIDSAIAARKSVITPQTPPVDFGPLTAKIRDLEEKIQTLSILIDKKESVIHQPDYECPKSKEYKERIEELESELEDIKKNPKVDNI